MKKYYCYLYLLVASLCLLSCDESNAQKGGTPDAVKQNFQTMYPGENDPDWDTDKNGNYEANFKKKGVHYRADYSPDGKWIETENSVKEKDLPKAIKELLEKSYDDFKIIELEFVSHYQKGEFYDLELKAKGNDKFDLMVKADGQIIGRD